MFIRSLVRLSLFALPALIPAAMPLPLEAASVHGSAPESVASRGSAYVAASATESVPFPGSAHVAASARAGASTPERARAATAAPRARSTVSARPSAPTAQVRKTTYMVAMRDGTHLATDVYMRGSTPLPAILMRTTYNKDVDHTQVAEFIGQGYAVIVQDIRGTYGSEGVFDGFQSDGWGANQDGYDTIEWIAAQPWCNGKVGMIGISARGIAAYLAAGTIPPHLTCVFAMMATGDMYDIAYQGGAYREELIDGWLGNHGSDGLLELIQANPMYDALWKPMYIPDRFSMLNVPMFHAGGWYDPFREGNLQFYQGISRYGVGQARGNQWLVMGPWTHIWNWSRQQGDLTYPVNATWNQVDMEKKFFGYWLRGIDDGFTTTPKVQYYLMGAVGEAGAPGNEWKSADAWPVPATSQTFYFQADGSLSFTAGNGKPIAYAYDPADPSPTDGGNNLEIPAGPADQSEIETRYDQLSFSTPVLSSPLTITGDIVANLYVSSLAMDTDFVVKVSDVYPDGRSMLVLDGVLRMRARDGVDHAVWMTPGVIYPIQVNVGDTAIVLNKGHQLRVAVSSSNSTRYSANPGVEDMFATTGEVTTNTLYLDAAHPSNIVLPVVP